MSVRRTRRSQRFLLVCVLALLLASGLAACNGSSEDAPAPGPAQAADPAASPASDALVSPAETPPPPTPPDIPVPEPPASSAPDPAAVPGEPSPPAAERPAPAPQSFRYAAYDRSGAVSEPGHYAFLADPADPASVVTTYEGLRDGTATALLIHTHDAHGVSQADLYDAVEAGDLVEWRQADDCFVRYQVTEVSEPVAAAVARTIGVVWMTYAFTGCSGAITGDTAATFEWGDLPDLGGTSLTAPIRHGTYQILPEGWTGVKEEPVYHEPPAANYSYGFRTKNLAEARRLPYWRDPALPAGWTFVSASSGPESVSYGYEAWYRSPHGGLGLLIVGAHESYQGLPERAVRGYQSRGVLETRVIAGRPASVIYNPRPNHNPSSPTVVRVFDPATESHYTLYGYTGSLLGANIDPLIAIARSLFEPPNAP